MHPRQSSIRWESSYSVHRSSASLRVPCKFFPILALFQYLGSLVTDGQKWTQCPLTLGSHWCRFCLPRWSWEAPGTCLPRAHACVGIAGRPCPGRPSGQSPTSEVPKAWLCTCHRLSCPWRGEVSILSLGGNSVLGPQAGDVRPPDVREY